MITTSKDGFATSQTEILNSLKDCLSCDVDFKREALKKIDSLLLLVGLSIRVAAVDLPDENEVFLKNLIGLIMR